MQVARKEKKLHEIESERLMYEAMCDRIGKHLAVKKHLSKEEVIAMQRKKARCIR